MDEYSGYLFTDDPQVAIDLCGGLLYDSESPSITETGVRYAAEFTDGRGFAAFDTDREGLYHLGTLGDVLVIADPDHPDTWPDWAKAPHKRFESTLENRFALYPVSHNHPATAMFENFMRLHAPKAGALVSSGPLGEFYIIIEDGPDWVGPENAIWDCGVTRFEDARVLA